MLKGATEPYSSEGLGIKGWPETDRPREKLLRKGPGALSDAELVALFVRSGTRGRTAVDIARGAISASGGLRGLLDLDREDICRLPGFGPARYVELQACLEISRRHLAAQLARGKPLTTPEDTSRFLMAKLRHLPFEVFSCLFLDNRHRVIEFEEMFRGTIDGTTVHAREVVRRTLNLNAAAVIFAHNHPSGGGGAKRVGSAPHRPARERALDGRGAGARPPRRRGRGVRLLRRAGLALARKSRQLPGSRTRICLL